MLISSTVFWGKLIGSERSTLIKTVNSSR